MWPKQSQSEFFPGTIIWTVGEKKVFYWDSLIWGYQWLCSPPSRKVQSEIGGNEANIQGEAEMRQTDTDTHTHTQVDWGPPGWVLSLGPLTWAGLGWASLPCSVSGPLLCRLCPPSQYHQLQRASTITYLLKTLNPYTSVISRALDLYV